MKKVSIVLFALLLALAFIFVRIGGVYNKQFWLDFLPGLMENLAILGVGVLLIESIFNRERLSRLRQTNIRPSRFVFFLSNRLAYKVLEYLAMATREEFSADPHLEFEFAIERMRGTDLAGILYEQLMRAEDKETFAAGFENILSGEATGITKALENIYPRPDPAIMELVDQMSFSIGSLGGLEALAGAFKATNKQVGPEHQLKPEHLELLIKVVYGRIAEQLERIRITIIKLSDDAKANKLFVSLE